MKIALAQIDMRLGDIEGICARIERQVELAARAGASLLCVPAPLMAGIAPGALVASSGYEHDLVSALSALAQRIEQTDVTVLVPAPVQFEGEAVFEVFLLKEGHTVPLRCSHARARRGAGASADDAWLPVIFDLDGLRTVIMFDAEQTVPILPTGCDVAIRFQTRPFCATDPSTTGAAGAEESGLCGLADSRGVWIASMEPVGAYDEHVFCGGSFFIDDGGKIAAASPFFEEDLLVCEVRRGMAPAPAALPDVPAYNRDEWTWQALVLALRSAARARGTERAAVLLRGDLPSALTAMLAVDAFGPRNVCGLFIASDDETTPRQAAEELDRAEIVRTLAARLHLRLIEREASAFFAPGELSTETTQALKRVERHAQGLYFETLARSFGALAVSSITKTDRALAAESFAGGFEGDIAPFGDIYLTRLEFIARRRNRESAAIPAELVSLAETERCMARVLACALQTSGTDAIANGRMAQLLAALAPSDVDAALEAHVDRAAAFEEIPTAGTRGAAVALLLMFARRAEAARRELPACPLISGGDFSQRRWPADLAWSDTGAAGADPQTLPGLVDAEIARVSEENEGAGERQRREVLGFLGEVLGISPDDLEEMASSGERLRISADMEKIADRLRETFEGLKGQAPGSDDADSGEGQMPPLGGPFPFFSQN